MGSMASYKYNETPLYSGYRNITDKLLWPDCFAVEIHVLVTPPEQTPHYDNKLSLEMLDLYA